MIRVEINVHSEIFARQNRMTFLYTKRYFKLSAASVLRALRPFNHAR